MALENVNKEQVRDDLVAHLQSSVKQDDAEIDMRKEDAAPIEQDEHRVDDISHQDEAGDVHALFQEVNDKQLALVKVAKALDVSPKSTVEAGAIITLDDENYVVGVASDEFTSGSLTFSGISSDAPIYEALAGKAAGDSVEFNGGTHKVSAVK